MTNPIDRALDRVIARIMVWRHRSKYFDHFSRAILRYDGVNGGRLAAAIAYYGFFAVFALLLIGYSVFGILLNNNDELFDIVREFLAQNLPFLDTQQILDSGRTVGVVGIIGLIWTGLGWIEAIRSSQRAIWQIDEHPGYIGIRQLVDLAVLLGILTLLGLSVGAINLLEQLLAWVSDGHAGWLLTAVSWIATIAINLLLAAALLAAVPRMVTPVLQVGIGITLLNTVGKYAIGIVERNPAYGLVASAVGVLFYLYVFNQILLFGAAWAATSPHGRVVDLAADDKNTPVGQNTWIRHHSP